MVKKIDFENIFLMALGDDKDERMLKWYLQNNINLVSYLDSKGNLDFVDLILTLVPREKRREMVGDTSSRRILKLMETDKPKLHRTIIQHPKGVEWLEANIENFKKRFL